MEFQGINPNTQTPISSTLASDLAANPNWKREKPIALLDAVVDQLKARVLSDIAKVEHAYHNLDHTLGVMARVTALAQMADISVVDRQLLLLAAMFHDYGHAGNHNSSACRGC